MIIINKLQRKFFPSTHDKWIKKWRADGGDYKLRFSYNLNPDSLVMDLGGYQGQWASDLFSRYCCKIMIFEPVSQFAHNIEQRFKKNKKILIYQYGLGGSSRKQAIGVCGDGSSLFFKKANIKEDVEIVDVAKWLNSKMIKSIDLMKINIEGGEYELLERLIETELIKNIKNIQVQFHNIRKDSGLRMEGIQNRLVETHSPTYQYRFVWESWTRKDEDNTNP